MSKELENCLSATKDSEQLIALKTLVQRTDQK